MFNPGGFFEICVYGTLCSLLAISRHPQDVVALLPPLSPEFNPHGKAKIRLTTVSFSSILHSSFLAVSNNSTSNFWRIYEVDYPEGPNMKAPRGFRNSLWSLSCFHLSQTQNIYLPYKHLKGREKQGFISKADMLGFAEKSTKEVMPGHIRENGESKILGHLSITLERSDR